VTEQSILKRYVAREESPGTSALTDDEGADDLGAFGWLRGIRDRAVMLELRKKDGSILAVGYGYMDHAEFDPSEGITLSVAGRKIHLKGRNLNAEVRPTVRLFEGITRHRVSWIQEVDAKGSMESPDDATLIDEIKW
jgi:hypothetical protein